MKIINISLLSILFLFLSSTIINANDDNSDIIIRNTKWGMSKADIENIEEGKKPTKITDNELTYRDKVFDKEEFVVYRFDDNKLVKIQLLFPNLKNDEVNKFYNNIDKTLNKKYKTSKKQEYNFLSSMSKYYTNDSETTNIFLMKVKDAVVVSYTEKTYDERTDKEWMDEINEEIRKEDEEYQKSF